MLEPVPFTDVQIKDRFWSPRQETNRTITIPHCLEMLEQAGNFHNFRLAAEGKHEDYKGPRYMDSDVYKTVEGICYSLATHPDPALEARLDEIIALIASAQMPDGYLNTWHQVTRPDKRWTNLRDDHELYCAGHLIEAAVAHALSLPPKERQGDVPRIGVPGDAGQTRDPRSKLLDVALKFCEHIWQQFGPDGIHAYPGHPEIELALVKLWKLTGDQRWFDLAGLFIERRGSGYFRREHNGEMKAPFDERYFVDIPIDQLVRGTGHAVRFCYLLSGATDVAGIKGDQHAIGSSKFLWRKVMECQTYITGGVGSNPGTEGFADPYDLPNENAYQETCASIALAMWGHRMALARGEAECMDGVEGALYNAVISGVGVDGKTFFYENPLASGELGYSGFEDRDTFRRQPWFECACCPPNILRTIASIGDYAYAKSDDALYVNLFVGGSLKTRIGGHEFAMKLETDYPWNGRVVIEIGGDSRADINIRVPNWCKKPVVFLSHGRVKPEFHDGYFVLHGPWKADDQIIIDLPMEVEGMIASPSVKADSGMVSIRRGPIVYCLEQIDTKIPMRQISIPTPRGSALIDAGLMGGCGVVDVEAAWHEPHEPLYRTMSDDMLTIIRMIPYAFWANREPCAMRVWIPR